MNHRQFKHLSPRQLRESVRESQPAERVSTQAGQEVDTRQIGQAPPGPAVDADPGDHASIDSEPEPASKTVTASLHYLNGSMLAEVPCAVSAGEIVIGRGNSASISIDDPYVHRVHARLTWIPEKQTHIIAHAGGVNATYVNRRKIDVPVQLHSENRIRIGKSEFIYRVR